MKKRSAKLLMLLVFVIAIVIGMELASLAGTVSVPAAKVILSTPYQNEKNVFFCTDKEEYSLYIRLEYDRKLAETVKNAALILSLIHI
ncbi:MAG: hypothetical protein N2376_13045, partial [Clostridia bacterium]|nr:hypothetical protein [Clostridia bacterium]